MWDVNFVKMGSRGSKEVYIILYTYSITFLFFNKREREEKKCAEKNIFPEKKKKREREILEINQRKQQI